VAAMDQQPEAATEAVEAIHYREACNFIVVLFGFLCSNIKF